MGKHPREYIINPQHYSFDPSNEFTEGQEVMTPDGSGVITEQDSCEESFPSGKFLVWLDRWGVKIAGYDKPRFYPTARIAAT